MNTNLLLDRFFQQLAIPYTAETIFDCLPNLVYFIKNRRAEYIVVNKGIVERCGLQSKQDLLGRTSKDVFPKPLGQSYWEQDLRLLASRTPVLNQLELHLYPNHTAGWCLTNKFPLYDAQGEVVGLVGVSYDIHSPHESAEEHAGVAKAVRYARENLDAELSASKLAKIATLSLYQFDKRIRKLFLLSTGQLIVKLRMDLASELLQETAQSIAEIAQACGYGDQSAFSRQFRRTTGLTPGDYRRRTQIKPIPIAGKGPKTVCDN